MNFSKSVSMVFLVVFSALTSFAEAPKSDQVIFLKFDKKMTLEFSLNSPTGELKKDFKLSDKFKSLLVSGKSSLVEAKSVKSKDGYTDIMHIRMDLQKIGFDNPHIKSEKIEAGEIHEFSTGSDGGYTQYYLKLKDKKDFIVLKTMEPIKIQTSSLKVSSK